MANEQKYCCYHLVRPYAPYDVAYVGIGHLGRPHEHAVMAARGVHYNKILQRIFNKARKLGFTALTVILVAENLTWEEACLREKAEIALYGRKDKKTGCLANLTDGGDGMVGAVVSEETRRKIGTSNVNNVFSEEGRRKISATHKGKRVSVETRVKQSLSAKGKKHSEETLARQRAAGKAAWESGKMASVHVGSKRTEESRQRMSNARKGYKPTEEARRHMSEAQTGRKHSDETREKMSAAAVIASARRKDRALREGQLNDRRHQP